MPARARTACAATPAAGLLALLAAGCTVCPPQPLLVANAPPQFVAWLCADACRLGFPAADPLPYHAGAPATRLADGSFEVRYQRRDDGRWTPRADGRLIAPRIAGTEIPGDVRYVAAAGLTGWRSVDAEFVVTIAVTPAGADIRTSARGFDPEPLLRHLHAAAQFAQALACAGETGASLRSCCAQHANWRAVALLRAARDRQRDNDLLALRDTLRAVRAVAADLPGLDYHIGAVEHAIGQDELAAPRLRTASRSEADPVTRCSAWASARSSSTRNTQRDSESMRRAALTALEAGRLEAAAALAHAATATAPDPVADLQLRHRLQRARDDRFGSLGTALLLREYGGQSGVDAGVDRLLAEDYAEVGHWQLARRTAARLLVDQLPASDLFAALQSAGAGLAQSAWIGWSEAVSGWAATPPR